MTLADEDDIAGAELEALVPSCVAQFLLAEPVAGRKDVDAVQGRDVQQHPRAMMGGCFSAL